MAGAPADSRHSALLEREVHLERIDRLIGASLAGEGHAVVIEGGSGIGKTALLTELRRRAKAAGMATCAARASELEEEFAFGIVRQLFEPAVSALTEEERSRLFVGATALAIPVLELAGEQSPGGVFAALHGLYWLAADLSARAPLLLAVDDAHWADLPSLQWLAYLQHRLAGLPILVAITTRPVKSDLAEAATALAAEPGVDLLQLSPLGEPSVAELLAGALGSRPDARFTAACHEATAGNPLALHGVISDLVSQGIRPTATAAATLDRQVPAAVARRVLTRLAREGAPAFRFARALAVLGDGTELRRVARLADLSGPAASEASDRLTVAELLAQERPARFSHPLLRAAVYDDIPLGLRSLLHGRAADLLHAEGADAEAVAAHVLRCDPGDTPEAVERLRAAARSAQRRGAPTVAAGYLRRALTEVTEETTRVIVLAELGRAELMAGDRAAADHLRAAAAGCSDPVLKGVLRNDQADAVRAHGERTQSLQLRLLALQDLGDRDPETSERIRVRISVPLLMTRPSPAATGPIERLRGLAEGTGPVARLGRLTLGFLLMIYGAPPDEVWSSIDRGLDGGGFLHEETSDAPWAWWAGKALEGIDELAPARAFASEMLADAARRGSMIGFGAGSELSGIVNLRAGMLADAEAGFRAALEVMQPGDLFWTTSAIHLAETLAELGKLDAAREQIERAPMTPGMEGDAWGAWILATRGRVLCAAGETDRGIADLRACGELAEDLRLVSPVNFPWRADLALSLAAHSPAEAGGLAQKGLEVARRAGIPSAIGVALRAVAALQPSSEAVTLLAEAAAAVESSPALLSRARILLDLGAALRRCGRRVEAREPLRRALELAASCGAVPLVERAREEAILAGARPRRARLRGVDSLTPAELRTARLAADGRSNREIAQALFITTKTVADHLGSAYSKLDVTSRAELPAALAP